MRVESAIRDPVKEDCPSRRSWPRLPVRARWPARTSPAQTIAARSPPTRDLPRHLGSLRRQHGCVWPVPRYHVACRCTIEHELADSARSVSLLHAHPPGHGRLYSIYWLACAGNAAQEEGRSTEGQPVCAQPQEAAAVAAVTAVGADAASAGAVGSGTAAPAVPAACPPLCRSILAAVHVSKTECVFVCGHWRCPRSAPATSAAAT